MFQQTNLDKWERISVRRFGFSVDAPVLRLNDFFSDATFESNTGFGLYYFLLNPIHSGALTEDQYVIGAYFAVMSAEQYRVIQGKNGYYAYSRVFADTLHVYHDQEKEYPVDYFGKAAHAYRRDFKGPDGQIVAVSILRYDYADAERFKTSDMTAIHRILSSVRFEKSPASDK